MNSQYYGLKQKENKIKIILYFNEINRIFIRYYFLTK